MLKDFFSNFFTIERFIVFGVLSSFVNLAYLIAIWRKLNEKDKDNK